ncbi:MAG TPA: helix-turn-helix transcriptional regulator [Candidatus Limnocylindrales bacterium]|nr:helix-turn-helix transcriptional regulator [Candidatus Limnocylindrales bacterium]
MTDDGRLDLLGHALADPTRRRLLRLLRESPGLTTGELAAAVPGLTRWAVMKHLDALRAAGLVQTLHEGRRRRHYRDPRGLDELFAWLERDRAADGR